MENYVRFLREELGPFLENVPLIIRQNMYFLHDGAPAHFSRVARDRLNRNYDQRWIGRGGPVAWSPRSPDINPLDFYLWGYVKSIVYRNALNNIADLKQRIIHGFEEIRRDPNVFQRVRNSFDRRITACIRAEGDHFEHLTSITPLIRFKYLFMFVL